MKGGGCGSGDLELPAVGLLPRVRRRSRGVEAVVDVCRLRGVDIAGASEGNNDSNVEGVGVRVAIGVLGLLFDESCAAMGTRSSNSDPRLGPVVLERTHTRSPPILRTNPFATRRPRPRPSFCRVRESSSRENGLKRLGKKSWGMPGPVSLMLMTRNRDFGLRVAVTLMLPRSVNLTAFKKTQEMSLARSRSSTAHN